MAERRRRRLDAPRPTRVLSAAFGYEIAYVEGREIWSRPGGRFLGSTDERYEDVLDHDGTFFGSRSNRRLLDAYGHQVGTVRVGETIIVRPRTQSLPTQVLFTYRGDYRAAAVAAVLILAKLSERLAELVQE